MICSICGGTVEWQGPASNLSHTQCLDCGEPNSEEPEVIDEPVEAMGDYVSICYDERCNPPYIFRFFYDGEDDSEFYKQYETAQDCMDTAARRYPSNVIYWNVDRRG